MKPKRVTINRVNAAIAQFGYELHAGRGYFYFSPVFRLENQAPELYQSGVYVYTMNQLTLAQWVEELLDKIHRPKSELVITTCND